MHQRRTDEPNPEKSQEKGESESGEMPQRESAEPKSAKLNTEFGELGHASEGACTMPAKPSTTWASSLIGCKREEPKQRSPRGENELGEMHKERTAEPNPAKSKEKSELGKLQPQDNEDPNSASLKVEFGELGHASEGARTMPATPRTPWAGSLIGTREEPRRQQLQGENELGEMHQKRNADPNPRKPNGEFG